MVQHERAPWTRVTLFPRHLCTSLWEKQCTSHVTGITGGLSIQPGRTKIVQHIGHGHGVQPKPTSRTPTCRKHAAIQDKDETHDSQLSVVNVSKPTHWSAATSSASVLSCRCAALTQGLSLICVGVCFGLGRLNVPGRFRCSCPPLLPSTPFQRCVLFTDGQLEGVRQS